MKNANRHGVFEADTLEIVALAGRASASISICRCDDLLFRYAVALEYGIGGFSGPITMRSEGLATQAAARDAALTELIRRCPDAQPSYPRQVVNDLKNVRQALLKAKRQPSLFEVIT